MSEKISVDKSSESVLGSPEKLSRKEYTNLGLNSVKEETSKLMNNLEEYLKKVDLNEISQDDYENIHKIFGKILGSIGKATLILEYDLKGNKTPYGLDNTKK